MNQGRFPCRQMPEKSGTDAAFDVTTLAVTAGGASCCAEAGAIAAARTARRNKCHRGFSRKIRPRMLMIASVHDAPVLLGCGQSRPKTVSVHGARARCHCEARKGRTNPAPAQGALIASPQPVEDGRK